MKNISWLVGIFVLLFVATCSVSKPVNWKRVIELREKSFEEKGANEGLAERIPDQQILINHPMNMAMAMSMDSGMGVAIAVGMHKSNTKKTISAFEGVPKIDLIDLFEDMLTDTSQIDQIEALSVDLSNKDQRVVLQPYGYLFGYPKAKLETRLQIHIYGTNKGILKSIEVKVTSDERPLFNDQSWTAQQGALLIKEFEAASLELVNLVLTELQS